MGLIQGFKGKSLMEESVALQYKSLMKEAVELQYKLELMKKYVSSWGESENDEGTKLYLNARGHWPIFDWKNKVILFLSW